MQKVQQIMEDLAAERSDPERIDPFIGYGGTYYNL
jgi:hypothetical protein